jgi:hypothetical protein
MPNVHLSETERRRKQRTTKETNETKVQRVRHVREMRVAANQSAAGLHRNSRQENKLFLAYSIYFVSGLPKSAQRRFAPQSSFETPATFVLLPVFSLPF